MSKAARTFLLLVVTVVVLIAAMQLFADPAKGGLGPFGGQAPQQLAASELLNRLEQEPPGIKDGEWQLDKISGFLKDGTTRYEAMVGPRDTQIADTIYKKFDENNVPLDFRPPPPITNVLSILSIIAFPVMIGLMIWFLVLRPAQMGGNQALNFGRSRAKRVGESGTKITFDDVAGIEEAKQELYEIVDFLKNTKKYAALGAKIPKGILLTGPPGVGKTHLARAIAGEAGVPFFHISGSDFVEMFVGVGAARVRDLFETAKAHRPSLIFIDEIDAVGRQRGAGLGGGHDEREQTLNQMLVEMDGFDPNSGVILIAATNRPDVLDPALLRPGRFDRQIVVDAPDQPGRHAILKIHSKGKPFETDINLETIAKRTPGFTGADLANMLNEGALLAARRGHSRIQQEDLDEALDRVIAGPQRKSRIMDSKEREIIAYHEAGHAVIGELLENCDPVHKVTILPRGMSLGSTWHVPEADKFLVSKDELMDDVTALLGGRVAEEIVYARVWTGASNDLERVTRIARAMVCEYGMSEKLGTLALGRRAHNPFLGRDYNDERNYSEDVARQIDEEVRDIVDKSHRRATDMLTEHRGSLDAVVQALLERETLNRDDFLLVLAGKPLPAMPVPASPPDGGEETEDKEADKSRKTTIVPPRFEPGPA